MSCDTISTPFRCTSNWLLEGVTTRSTGSSWSASRRCSSRRVLEGTMAWVSSETGSRRGALYTASRKPSAPARVRTCSEASSLIPVSTGLVSSVAAAKTTRPMAVRRTCGSIRTVIPSSTVGMGGNSSASVPLIWAWKRAQRNWTPLGRAVNSMSIFSLGSEPTKSDRSRAGMVMAPSSSTIAPTQVVIASSKLVADSLSLDWSVSMRTF